MKIGFLSTVGAPWGGSEVLWVATALAALDAGHQVVASVYHWPDPVKAITDLGVAGADVVYLRRFFPPLHRRIAKRVLNSLPGSSFHSYHDHFLRKKVDLLHFSLGAGTEIASSVTDLYIFTQNLRIPYTIFCHELWMDDGIDEPMRDRLRRSFQDAAGVYFTSRYAANHVEEALGIRIGKLAILSHPLQEQAALQTLSVDPSETLRFCMFGRVVSSSKGHDTALRSLADRRFRDLDWVLDIIGNGVSKAALQELVGELGLEHRVRFLDPSADITDAIAPRDVFLFPSRTDTGPITLIECMLAGKVVVGNPIGLMHDLIEDGRNGFLSSGTDEHAFADAIERCFGQFSALRDVGAQARETVMASYDLDSARSLLRRFELIVNESR